MINNAVTAEYVVIDVTDDVTVRGMMSFCSIKVTRKPQYTRDFKYPHNQKSPANKSGDRGTNQTYTLDLSLSLE